MGKGSDLKKIEKELYEKEVVLKEVLGHLEDEKDMIRHQVCEFVEQVLIPGLKKIVGPNNKVDKKQYNSLMKSLQELASSLGGLLYLYSKLSTREIQICNLIKKGATSVETAKTLSISPATIQKHRESIRRKLNITNKKVNLATYLKGFEAPKIMEKNK